MLKKFRVKISDIDKRPIFQIVSIKWKKSFIKSVSAELEVTNGWYYKSFTIVIYDCIDSA